MDVHDKIAEVIAFVEAARSVPMSSSAVVNRPELLAMLTELQQQLPDTLSSADQVLADRDKVLAEAREEAEVIVEEGRIRQGELVKAQAVVAAADAEAVRVRATAMAEAEVTKREANDFADARMANFEVVLARLLEAVRGGREHLANAEYLPDLNADLEGGSIPAEATSSGPASDDPASSAPDDRDPAGRIELPPMRSSSPRASDTTGWTPQSA